MLVEGDDIDQPTNTAVGTILDGHIQLSRSLAEEGHYPAVDVLRSVSRLMVDVVDDGHYQAAAYIKRLIAAYEDAKDLIRIGAYQRGADPRVDEAVENMGDIRTFLNQDSRQRSSFAETRERLGILAKSAERD